MHKERIEKYFDMVKKFPQNEQTVMDALIRACDSPKFPIVEDEARAFIYRSMQNAIKDQQRKENKMKMTSEVTEKEFNTTKGQKKVKKTFEQFYAAWLLDNNQTDSFRNRSAAEDEWDSIGVTFNRQPIEVSLSEPIYTNSDGDKLTLEGTLADPGMNPEELAIHNEEIEQMANLVGVKDQKLRSFLLRYVGRSDDMKTMYRRAMLHLVAEMPSWKSLPQSDLQWLCDRSNSRLENLMSLSPSAAKHVLNGKTLGAA
jgi:hypothetical protein